MSHETKQLLRNIAIGLGLFLVVGLVLYGVWHGTRLPRLTISEVNVYGGETISHTAVASDVEQLLAGEYLRFVPRKFAWTYPEQEIMDQLNSVERVKNPQIERTGRSLDITLAEYEPAALWCDVTATSTCAFIDTTGYAFALAPNLTGGAFVRYYRVGQTAKTGESFTDSADYDELMTLVALLEQKGWPVVSVELDQARDVFVDIVGGGELKVSLLLTPEETLDNLQTILVTEQYRHLKPGNFAYIDLRFGNKVFVSEFGTPTEIIAEEAELELADETEAEAVVEVETETTTSTLESEQ